MSVTTIVLVVIALVLVAAVAGPRIWPLIKDYLDSRKGDTGKDQDSRVKPDDVIDLNEQDLPNFEHVPLTRIVIYYTNWTRYRVGGPKAFLVEDIPYNRCTHAIYSFFALGENFEVTISDPWADLNLNGMRDFLALKSKPGSKIKYALFTIGGWNYSGPGMRPGCYNYRRTTENEDQYPQVPFTRPHQETWHMMLTSKDNRKTFIDSIQGFTRLWPFDGLDLDYEYPGCPHGDCQQQWQSQNQGFVSLLKELRERMGPNFVLSIASAAGPKTIAGGPDMGEIAANLDEINIMTYDYHVSVVGQPINHNQPKIESKDDLDVDTTLKIYINDYKVPPEKINIGIPCYGRGFQLTEELRQRVERTHNPMAIIGRKANLPFTHNGESGIGTLHDFCWELKATNKISKTWYVPKIGSFFTSTTNAVFSFPDTRDIWYVNQLRNKYQIPGLMIYAIDQDDYTGACSKGTFPILAMTENPEGIDPDDKLLG
jgi:chitinase